ncbi:lipid II:glycine glycyltransferase FemX [Pedosphaera parvula]|nr:peptidoglycan bridge formation glycyltransferase FemA/FemB family protein [Pedosphaera parvula]
MSYTVEIDKVSSAEWSGLMELFEDSNPYQTWSYGAIRWGEENLSHLVLRKGDSSVMAMAQLRIIRPKLVGGGVAYLRWGPICHLRGATLDLQTVKLVMKELHEEYVRKRKLFLRILPDAFVGSPRAGIFEEAFSEYGEVQPGRASADRTFVLDLTPTLEELRKKLDQKWRNQLNRSEKNNLTIVEGTGREEYKVFVKIYEEMWARKKFDTTVDVHEFGRITEDLPGGQKFKTLICQREGVPVCGIVCSAVGSMGIYLLGATNDQGLDSKGAYLLQWTMIKWLKENGFKYYDLGGIDPELNPGVYHFKKGFSAEDMTRMAPLESCEAVMSSLFMKAADFGRGGAQKAASKFKNDVAGAIGRLKPAPKLNQAEPGNPNT